MFSFLSESLLQSELLEESPAEVDASDHQVLVEGEVEAQDLELGQGVAPQCEVDHEEVLCCWQACCCWNRHGFSTRCPMPSCPGWARSKSRSWHCWRSPCSPSRTYCRCCTCRWQLMFRDPGHCIRGIWWRNNLNRRSDRFCCTCSLWVAASPKRALSFFNVKA